MSKIHKKYNKTGLKKKDGPATVNKQAYLHTHDEHCHDHFNLCLTVGCSSSYVGLN